MMRTQDIGDLRLAFLLFGMRGIALERLEEAVEQARTVC